MIGLFETSDGEEIKEQAAMCLRKQRPLCLKEAGQNGQLNIIRNKFIREIYMKINKKIIKSSLI